MIAILSVQWKVIAWRISGVKLSLSLLIAGMSVNAGDLIAQYHLGLSEQINTCLRHKIECKYPARVLQEKEREREQKTQFRL